MISEAKSKGTLKKADWDKAKGKYGLTGEKEKCCIHLKKKQGSPHFMCLVDNESKTCEILVQGWVKLLNSYSSNQNFAEEIDLIKEDAQGLSCDDKKLNVIKRRLINAALF